MTKPGIFAGDVVKSAATAFLFIVAVTCFGIYAYDTVLGHAIPETVSQVVIASMTVALSAAGFNHGVTVANGTAQDTANSTVAAFVSAQNTGQIPVVPGPAPVGVTNAGQNKSDGGLTTG